MTHVKNVRTTKETTKLSMVRTQAKPKKTKKDQLIALLSKPNGAKISTLCKALGWQNHTVRAALSDLRKQGLKIETSKSVKDGETIYAAIGEHSSGALS